MENETLATELLKEIKASARRWFIIAMVELAIILGITGTFVWYISLPVDEVNSYAQNADNIQASTVTQDIRGTE